MKKTLLLLALIFTFSACAPAPLESSAPVAESQSLATPVAPSFEIIPNPRLTQLEMIDAQNGWGQAEGMVLRTEDGGSTWLNATPDDIFSNPAYAKSFFLNEKTGWIILEDTDKPNAGTIFRTTDGGENWRWRNIPFGRAEFGFIDSENGYALFSMGAGAGSMGISVWTTSNGGGDYNRVFFHEPGFEYTMPFNGIKNGIAFHDPLNGWVTGSIPQDGIIWFYRTRDGGFVWEEQPLQMPTGYESAQTTTHTPRFFDGDLALLPVGLFSQNSAMVFYRSTDSGETWAATLPVPMSGKYAIASANELIVWDGGATLYASQNGGETWSFHATNWQPSDLLKTIDFVSITEGWALSEDGLYHTQDGGRTWEKLGE